MIALNFLPLMRRERPAYLKLPLIGGHQKPSRNTKSETVSPSAAEIKEPIAQMARPPIAPPKAPSRSLASAPATHAKGLK
jgi:hypothetical protein